MKEILKNRKGFTLIELLAVIVILAILVMVAIPAVTRILTDARKGTYADTALHAIETVRNDYNLNGNGTSAVYTMSQINDLLEKKLASPFGETIKDAKITVTISKDANNNATAEYSMCIWDARGNGFDLTKENQIKKTEVLLDQGDNKTC